MCSMIHWFMDSLIHWFIDSLSQWFMGAFSKVESAIFCCATSMCPPLVVFVWVPLFCVTSRPFVSLLCPRPCMWPLSTPREFLLTPLCVSQGYELLNPKLNGTWRQTINCLVCDLLPEATVFLPLGNAETTWVRLYWQRSDLIYIYTYVWWVVQSCLIWILLKAGTGVVHVGLGVLLFVSNLWTKKTFSCKSTHAKHV